MKKIFAILLLAVMFSGAVALVAPAANAQWWGGCGGGCGRSYISVSRTWVMPAWNRCGCGSGYGWGGGWGW